MCVCTDNKFVCFQLSLALSAKKPFFVSPLEMRPMQLKSHSLVREPLKALTLFEKSQTFEKLPNLKIFPSAAKTPISETKVRLDGWVHLSRDRVSSAAYCLYVGSVRSDDETGRFVSPRRCFDHRRQSLSCFALVGFGQIPAMPRRSPGEIQDLRSRQC